MFDFRRLVAGALCTGAFTTDEQLERVALLQGAERVCVTEPEHDNTGRWWFFIGGVVRGTPISVPHVVSLDGPGRVVDASRLMQFYRRSIVDELRRRAFPVVADATPARGEPL